MNLNLTFLQSSCSIWNPFQSVWKWPGKGVSICYYAKLRNFESFHLIVLKNMIFQYPLPTWWGLYKFFSGKRHTILLVNVVCIGYVNTLEAIDLGRYGYSLNIWYLENERWKRSVTNSVVLQMLSKTIWVGIISLNKHFSFLSTAGKHTFAPCL